LALGLGLKLEGGVEVPGGDCAVLLIEIMVSPREVEGAVIKTKKP